MEEEGRGQGSGSGHTDTGRRETGLRLKAGQSRSGRGKDSCAEARRGSWGVIGPGR
jgi:hypothetical protein